MSDLKWLEDAVLDYIKNHPDKRFDSVDIVNHFRLSADITLRAVWNLQQVGKINRVNNGLSYFYKLTV